MTPNDLPGRTLSHRNLHGRIAHDLGMRIMSGKLAPGETLPSESDYSTMLAVSRTALREAIKILAAKGLVESKPKIGTRVRASDHWNTLDPDVLAWSYATADEALLCREMFELRVMVEPPAAALAAQRAPEAQLAGISAAYEEMVASRDDPNAGVAPDVRFHLGILKAAGNKFLVPMASLVETALIAGLKVASALPEGRRRTLPHHKKVLDAILIRDPSGARAAMEELLAQSMADVRDVLAPGLARGLPPCAPFAIRD